MGSGRSGTSLMGGMLSDAGYFMGENLIEGDDSNPRGFYESRDINGLNEDILRSVLPERPHGWRRHFFRQGLRRDQQWLARLPVAATPIAGLRLRRRIRALTARAPYCFKDPRFCYTLPTWTPFLGDALRICVFRDPGRTVRSLLHHCETSWYLGDITMTPEWAAELWTLMYRHVLEKHRGDGGEWIFVHYEQLLDGSAAPRLESALDTRVNQTFADPDLRRSRPRPVDAAARAVYKTLCLRADYRPADLT